jgi:hypothetical protein
MAFPSAALVTADVQRTGGVEIAVFTELSGWLLRNWLVNFD